MLNGIDSRKLVRKSEDIVETIVQNGFDPAKVVSCIPTGSLPGSIRGVRGCDVCDRCPFSQPKYGGFKGDWRPHNVAYYSKDNDGTNRQKQDYMVCHKFVSTMMDRKIANDTAISQGKPGQFIDIIGEEGTLITTKVWGPDLDDPLNQNGMRKGRFRNIISTFPVPAYEHQADHAGDSYEAQLERGRMEREEKMQVMYRPDPVTADVDDNDDKAAKLASEWGAETA